MGIAGLFPPLMLKEFGANSAHIIEWLTEAISYDAEIKLNEFCQRVRQNLDNATIQDKRLALEALDIRVTASTRSIDIKGIIPVEFPTLPSSTDVTTTAQTSACLCFYRNICV